MITGLDPNLTQDYISKDDKGDPKTIWKLVPLSARAFASISVKSTDKTKAVEGMLEVVKNGLAGFSNFKDAKGQEIKFEPQSDKILDLIPLNIILELGSKILDISNLSSQEIKN